MSRKSNNLKTGKDLFYYYKWEFLRRNKSYQKDYDAVIKSGSSTKESIAKPNILKKYGVFPADYRNSYPNHSKFTGKVINNLSRKTKARIIKISELPEAIVFHSQFKPSGILRADAWSEQLLEENFNWIDRYSLGNIKFKRINPEKIPLLKEMKTLRLVIDINSSKERLVDSFKTMISFYKSLVDDDKKDSGRKRFNEYGRYLKVYDLKEQSKKWSWEKLAKRFYSGDVERGDMEYAKKKVKRDYNRCKKLIDGSYGQIR